VLEESYYWRGMAYQALGKSNQAIADLKKAAALNSNFALPRLELQRLGVTFP
jgi:tetratricopeptide (TPR) repeat protein